MLYCFGCLTSKILCQVELVANVTFQNPWKMENSYQCPQPTFLTTKGDRAYHQSPIVFWFVSWFLVGQGINSKEIGVSSRCLMFVFFQFFFFFGSRTLAHSKQAFKFQNIFQNVPIVGKTLEDPPDKKVPTSDLRIGGI